MSFRYRKDRKTWLVDNVWPDKVRTRISAPDKATAAKIDLKIRAAMLDEKRVWKKLRSDLGLDGERLQGFSELADEYFQSYMLNHNRSPIFKQSRLVVIKRHFGNTPVESITNYQVDKFISTRKRDGISNSTINRDLAVLQHLYSWLLSRGYQFENPLCVKNLKDI